MMEILLVFLVAFLVINGYVFLEEETIIIFCFFVWLDAAGGVIKNLLVEELDNRADVLKEKFVWYLEARGMLVETLKEYHNGRKLVHLEYSKWYSGWFSKNIEVLSKGIIEQSIFIEERKSIEEGLYILIKNWYGYQYLMRSISGAEDLGDIGDFKINEERLNHFFAGNNSSSSVLNINNFTAK